MSILFLFLSTYIESYFPQVEFEYAFRSFVALFVFSIFGLALPFKRHIENGSITFYEDQFQIEIYSKKMSYIVKELNSLKFHISGFYGEDEPVPNRVFTVNNGSGNFIILDHNFETKKFEFFLSSKENLAMLKNYIRKYEKLTALTVE